MGYDIFIQSDEALSEAVALQPLKDFIRHLPGMAYEGETGFTYGDGRQYYMEVDLEFADEDGHTIRGAVLQRGMVNRISMHIPAAHLDQDHMEGSPYADVCVQIARHLGWRVFDPQYGIYLEA